MFWDKAAGLYNLFEDFYNGKVNHELVRKVTGLITSNDRVLECACGTGMISKGIASRCKELIATDYSDGMLRQSKKNLAQFSNVKVRRANIMQLKARDCSFDKVVAANVIHLLDDPNQALNELMRVCKKGGKVIIPTYVNKENAGTPNLFVKMLAKFGAGFKCQFDYASYQEFFRKAGYQNAEFFIVEGKMPCAVALITKL